MQDAYERALDWIDYRNGRLILEIGSGTGEAAIWHAKRHPSDALVLLDSNSRHTKTAIFRCREQRVSNVFCVCSEAHLALAQLEIDDPFEWVVCKYPTPYSNVGKQVEKLFDSLTCDQLLRVTGAGSWFFAESDRSLVTDAFKRRLSPPFYPTDANPGFSLGGTDMSDKFGGGGYARIFTVIMRRDR